MDTIHGGTGVFYQAMPAIGADGKNIMKLIPVQMVNRQFFQTQTTKPQTDPVSQKAVTINMDSAPVNMATKTLLSSSASQQIIRKQVSVVNVNLDHSNSLNKHSSQQKTQIAEVTPVATFTKKSGMPVKHFNQLPVTVKSPALPRGQYLQIPPNAQVQTVPASRLPPGIQKQILTSSASSSLGSVLPNVVFVSPVTTVNQSGAPPSDAAPQPLQIIASASSVTSCGPQQKEAKQQLKLIPKVSQRPNSPTRWVIEEADGSAGPNIKPLNCPAVTSEILRAVAQRENSCKQLKAFRRTVSHLSQDSAAQGQQNALVMCNGKVFFVAKKCTLPTKSTAATKGSELSKTIVPHFPSFQQFLQSAATHTRQDFRMPRESDDVIDLCGDDDDDDESPQQAASINMSAVSHLDEDNVIFVSYIPPKSESYSRNCTASNRARRGAEPRQATSDGNERRVCDSAVMYMNIQQSASTQQLESTEVDAVTESPVAPSSRFQAERNSDITEGSTNPEPPKPYLVSDHLLRKVFGITAELKVCLQRVDDAAVGSVPADPLHAESVRSAEDNEEPVGDVFVYEPSGSQKASINSGHTDFQRVKVLIGKELSASPLTGITARRCSHAKLNQKPFALEHTFFSAQSSHNRATCDCEAKRVTGYVKSVDENFQSKNENTIPQSQDVDAHLQTRRMGRTRKRTVCTCCMPATLDPAVKSRARLEELEKSALTAEQMSKKGARAKVPRKDGSCEEVKKKLNFNAHGAPVSDILSTSDSDELKRQEEIKRLKDILKEKEAALELMMNRVS